jgi:hypothetical protein
MFEVVVPSNPDDPVAVKAEGRAIVVRGALPHFTLAELFRERSAEAWRSEYSAAFEWDSDVGCEVVAN